MIVAVFVRRLRPGRTFEDFVEAWDAEQGFGVPTRVFAGVSVEDERDVLTVGFVDVSAAQLAEGMSSGVAAAEAERHSKIDDVIESTELRAFYDLRAERDFTAAPRPIEPGSAESLLRTLTAG